MTDPIAFLLENDYLMPRLLPGGRWAAVWPLVLGRGRIVAGRVMPDGHPEILDGW